jgi:hypothetical protein
MKMNDEQIKLLRLAVQQEIEYASIDGMEHGAWGWASQEADKLWKEFQESFNQEEDTSQTVTEEPQNPL